MWVAVEYRRGFQIFGRFGKNDLLSAKIVIC